MPPYWCIIYLLALLPSLTINYITTIYNFGVIGITNNLFFNHDSARLKKYSRFHLYEVHQPIVSFAFPVGTRLLDCPYTSPTWNTLYNGYPP